MPRVSVLVPAHNAARYVGAAIESILAQTFADLELLIVDDCSTDGTVGVVESFDDPRIRLIRNERQLGVVDTLNRGLALARGELISRHDADDTSAPDRLAQHVELFARDPGLVIGANAFAMVDDDGTILEVRRRPTSDTGIRWRALFLMPGIGHFTCRASVVRAHDIRFRIPDAAEDHGFWFDILPHGRAANSPDVLYYYRVHPEQASASLFDRQNAQSDLLARQSLARLGLDVPLEDVPVLRDIYLSPPRRRPPEYRRHFDTLLAAASALARQPGVDRDEMRTITRQVATKALVGLRGGGGFAGMAATALRADPGLPLAVARSKLRRRLSRS